MPLRLESAAHTHLLTVLCGLTFPNLPSLDSNQMPVLREMKEKQVRAVNGTSTRSTAIWVPFDADFFFFSDDEEAKRDKQFCGMT